MTQSAPRTAGSARADWWRRHWAFVLLSFLATLLWAFVGWWLPRRLPSLHSDSFGAINALFSGLALAGVIYTLWAQRREQDENAFGARLDSLVGHYAKFGESPHYRDARGLAWCCAQRACSDPEFLAAIRWWWSIPERAGEERGPPAHVTTLRGVFVLEEGTQQEGQPERLYSWNLALHRLDDLMTFFQVFAYELDICDRCATTREQLDRLRGIVRSMNVYWDEWGPLLRTIVAEASPGVLLHGAVAFDLTPNWDSAFDTIDRFFYPEEGWTRVKPRAAAPDKAREGERVSRLHGIVAVLCADKMYRLRCASAGAVSETVEDGKPRTAEVTTADRAKSDGAAPARL